MKFQVALFLLRGQVYALAVEEILIILQEPRIFSLPLLPPVVIGMLIHDGEAVPVVKPARLPRASEDGQYPCSYVVVCGTEFGVAGLPADKILHIVERRKGRLEVAQDPAGVDGSGRTFVYDQVRYPLLDIGHIVAELSLWDFRHPPPQGN
ncbi:MAG: hypothetical protein A2X84_04490 [Desulfuromonadaceae bacterium GWC2_58_13]|nr:MAG: hypothetical protein A2X84_04490 [Desulfuromonadaceae bacterium GWC2_58_13]